MSLEHDGESNDNSTAERLAELTGDPVEKFEYDGEVPDAEAQAWERVDE